MEEKNIVTGRNPVLEYLRSAARSFTALAVSETAHGKIIDAIISAAAMQKVKTTREGREFFKAFGPSSAHQGVVLFLGAQTAAVRQSEKTLTETALEQKGVLVLLDQINDPHNAGAVIRTAEALGCCGVVMPETNSVGITSSVVKVAAGATAHIPVKIITNAAAFITEAKNAGLWIIGTSDHGNATPEGISKYRPALIIIGSEGKGMRRLVSDMCDVIVSIPMRGQVSSLNASVAAGIIIHEIMKN
jgi:23S rRNA (guanosine2251-2'-O)-methyltransferase